MEIEGEGSGGDGDGDGGVGHYGFFVAQCGRDWLGFLWLGYVDWLDFSWLGGCWPDRLVELIWLACFSGLPEVW